MSKTWFLNFILTQISIKLNFFVRYFLVLIIPLEVSDWVNCLCAAGGSQMLHLPDEIFLEFGANHFLTGTLHLPQPFSLPHCSCMSSVHPHLIIKNNSPASTCPVCPDNVTTHQVCQGVVNWTEYKKDYNAVLFVRCWVLSCWSQLKLTALRLQALQAHTRHCTNNIDSVSCHKSYNYLLIVIKSLIIKISLAQKMEWSGSVTVRMTTIMKLVMAMTNQCDYDVYDDYGKHGDDDDDKPVL